MADIESNIDINIDASQALASIKRLQAEISAFHQAMAKGGAKANAEAALLQQELLNSINATGKFSASMRNVQTSTESFTESLEKNKFSLGQFFKYGASQITGFRRLFSTEFDTIDKVARERVKTLQTQYIKLGRDANGAMKAIAVRPLTLDMNDLGTKVAMTAQKQQIFNEILKQGSTNLLNFGKNTQWAGRQLMVGFTIPLSIFGATAAKEFMKLEEQTIRFQKVYGDFSTSAKSTDAMTASIKNLGLEFTKYGVAVEKTIGLAADAAAMGKTGAELTAQVSEATRLAVLGGVEQAQALETTISLTNAFGVSADKLAGKINFLNAVENQTVTSIEDLTIAIPKAGPVVQQLGGNVEDLAFFLTAMKEGGIDAGEGANALKSGLASMINPTQEASDMLAQFGINLKGIVDANKGDIKATVVGFAEALNQLDPLNRAQAIEQLFGKFQFARISTLFKNVTDQASQANRVLQLTASTQEELAVISEREMKRMENSPMYQFQSAVEKFQAALAPIGESFLKAVTPIINFGTDILNKFNEMGDGAKQFWTILVAAVGGLGPVLLMTFGLLANGVANIIKLFTVMGGLFGGLSGQSKLLGGATQYMTQEQLEAAAVAASLNQIHSDLIQTFTSEKSAVAGLAAVYRDAAIAIQGVQRPMMPGAPFPGASPKKYADGVYSVPGPKGAGDVVPAMLSPGEAVIPADKAEQYRGLIQGIIAGEIPGFMLGTDKVGDNFYPEDLNWVNQKLSHIPEDSGNRKTKTKLEDLLYRRIVTARKQQNDELVARLKTETEAHLAAGVASESKMKDAFRESPTGRQIFAEISPKTRPLSEQEHRLHAEQGKKESPKEFLGRKFDSNDVKLQRTKRLAELADIAGMSGTDGINFDTKSAFLRMGNGQLNLDQAGQGADIGAFAEDFASRSGVAAWGGKANTIKAGGGSESDQELLAGFDEFDETVLSVFEERKQKGVKFIADNTEQIKQLAEQRSIAENRPIADIEKEYDTLDSIYTDAQQRLRESNPNNKALPVIDAAKAKALEVRINASQANQKKLMDNLPEQYQEEARSILDANFAGGRTGNTIQVRGKMDAEGYADGVDEVLNDENQDPLMKMRSKQRNSPHPQAGIDGADDGKAYAEGFDEAAQDATRGKTGGSRIDPEAAQRVRDAAKVAQAEEDRRLGISMGPEAPVAPKPKPKTLVTGEVAMSEAQAVMNNATLASGALDGKGGKLGASMEKAVENLKSRFPKYADKIDSGLESLQRKLDLDGSFAEKEQQQRDLAIQAQQKLTDAINQRAARVAAGEAGVPDVNPALVLSGEELAAFEADDLKRKKEVVKEDKRQRRAKLAGRVMGAGMVATTALGVMSMAGGPMAEFAQGAMPAVGAATTLLPMLIGMGPILGSIVGAITALGAAAFVTIQHMDNARNSALKMADSLGSGTNAMKTLAEAAGNATSTEVMNKRRDAKTDLIQVQEGKTTFGENFIQGEAGQKMLKDVQEFAKSNGLKQAQEQIRNQMMTAVATGALSAGQARSIVAELAKKMGDEAFGVRLNGELISILGPNGEDIAKDPIGVRLEIMQESTKSVQSQLAAVAKQTSEKIWQDSSKPIWERWGEAAAVAGSVTGSIVSAVQQQQEMIDSLELEYEKRIEIAKAAGDLNRALMLQNELEGGKEDVIAQGQKSIESYIKAYKSASDEMKGEIGKALDTSIETAYKDDAVLQGQAILARNSAVEAARGLYGNNSAQEIQLKLSLASTEVSPTDMLNILDTFKNDQTTMDAFINVGTTGGYAMQGEVASLVNMFVDENGNPKEDIQRQFIANVNALSDNPEQMQSYIDAMSLIAQTGPVTGEVTLEFYTKNQDKLKEVQGMVDQVKEQAKKGPVTLEYLQNVVGSGAMDALRMDQAYFDSLPPEQQVTYVQTLLTVYETRGSAEYKTGFRAWYKEQGKKGWVKGDYAGKNAGNAALMAEYEAYNAYRATEASAAVTVEDAAPPPEDMGGGGSGGGGRTSSVLDDLLQKLRKIQMATLGLTEGWAGARQALDNLFPGGASNSPFQGIEQQMRRLGAKEDLITMIAGMDPEEFQKRKDELFTFDGAGNIVGFRNSLLSIGAALRSIKFGEFQSEQQKNVNVIKDQNDAIRKLIANGFSMADAYEMVQDAAFASAVAQESNNEIIRQATEDYKKATEAAKLFAAAKAATNANADVTATEGALAFIANNAGNLSNDVINEILTNKDFATLIMSPTLTQEQKDTLQQWINNIENETQLNLDVKLQTIEGMESIFSDGFSKAMEAFSAQEKKIELEFEVKKDPFQKTIENAQYLIDDIQNKPGGMDDLEADLDRIAFKEEDINKRYKERLDRLQEIKRNNDKILQQRKAELTVADAITQGDIAAAAKAIEDARAQQAQANMQAQQDMLERQKQAEIDALTGQMGMTREQIETRIRDLRQEILNIEETMIEPAQYQLSLLERQEKRQKEALTVLGMTRHEWETLNNRIQIAKTSSEEYKKAMENARDVVGKIVEYWTEIQKPKTTVHTIVTNYVTGSSSGAGNIGASGDSSGGGGGGSNPPPATTPSQTAAGDTTPAVLKNRYSQALASAFLKSSGGAGARASLVQKYNAWIAESTPSVKPAKANTLGQYLKSLGFNSGGLVPGYGSGDKIRAMLTPGEFVITKPAVDAYGARMMKDINNGTFQSGSVYNYSISVNVETGADADQIANTVMRKIKSVDSKRIQGNRF